MNVHVLWNIVPLALDKGLRPRDLLSMLGRIPAFIVIEKSTGTGDLKSHIQIAANWIAPEIANLLV